MGKKKILQNYKKLLEEGYELVDETIRVYIFVVEKFIDDVGLPPYNTADILDWQEKQRKYSRSYRNLQKWALIRFFESIGEEFPFLKSKRKGKRKKNIYAEERFRPILSFDEVVTLIENRSRLNKRQRAFLALSTTFGFRRVELAKLRSEQFNFNEGIFEVLIFKRRDYIKHRIPEVIKPYLVEYGFPETLSVSLLSKIFHQILRRCGFSGMKGYGWHSIRRRLAIELDNTRQLSYLEMNQFLGWTKPTEGEHRFVPRMVKRYSEREMFELDEKVFDIHPFLGVWQ